MRAGTAARHEGWARERFDAWSTSRGCERLQPWLAFVQRQALARIDWSCTTAVLDVACGSGRAVDEAALRLQGRDGLACGCDLSVGMLRQRRSTVGSAFVAASAQALPYRNDSFDALICTAAFHHFPDPLGALREFRRVLRPGGQALIADPCRDQSLGVWLWDRLHRWFEKGHVQYYRSDELRRLLHDAGFTAIEASVLHPRYAETNKLVRSVVLFAATAPHRGAG